MMIELVELSEGDLIRAPFLDGVGIVKKFDVKPGYYLLEIVLENSNIFLSKMLTEDQLNEVEILSDDLTFFEESINLFYLIEALRIRLAYQFDPLLAVNVSQVDPLPHQIEGVYNYALTQPKVRFLIADDAGAGKTIMAGLIVKELLYRNLANRVLIVVPGHLKYQWQREMKEKFGSSFVIVDRHLMASNWPENVWEERNFCITTIDFIKQDDIKTSLSSSQWDLIIVDEAHKLSAYAYGDNLYKTKRYQAGEILSEITTHLLFLTATPHRGNEENFRLFLDLLRPGFFSKTELLAESIQRKENPLFVRRLKEDMQDFKGNKLFPPRHVSTAEFKLTNDELDLYNAVTRYVRYYFNKAQKKRNISFAMMLLQRRLTSSIDAILLSLQRRKKRMEELLKLPEKIREQHDEYESLREYTEEELEDMEDEERIKIEEKLTNLTIAENIDDVKKEIEQLKDLIVKAEKVKQKEIESKLISLRDKILHNLEDRKLIIFTQFTDTLDYLVSKLRDWGYEVTRIDGRMGMDARITAEQEFKHESQILVATEAAGEGINLQFCSWMVNYDIPWNPNRLEQRMGRIHRYGQNKEVFIWNMISADTIEGQILKRIFDKMELMQQALGSDKVFDVIGERLEHTNFEKYFKEAVLQQRRIEEIYDMVDQIDEALVQTTLDQVFMTGLASRHIDYQNLLLKTKEADENRLMPEYIEGYFVRAFKFFKGRIDKVRDYWRVESVPFILRQLNDDYNFKTRYGRLLNRYSRITFEKSVARENPEYEYVAPGHPLLEAVNRRIIETFSKGERYAVFEDEQGGRHGVLWFVEGEVINGLGVAAGKRMFCLYQDVNGSISQVSPSVLWDLNPLSKASCDDECGILLKRRDSIQEYSVMNILFPYQSEIVEDCLKTCEIKEKYGVKSLGYLIQDSVQRILEYQEKQQQGVDMDLPLLREERKKELLEQKLEGLQREIVLERNLTVSEPRIIGATVVIPKDVDATGSLMVRDDEIEAVGMTVATEYELADGWVPEDVSKKNVGFDIRSTKYNQDGTFGSIRYIEVKARAQSGALHISANEWKKAQRFKEDFWLYVVTMAGSESPLLNRIQNPSKKFIMEEDLYATGYNVPYEKWANKVEEM